MNCSKNSAWKRIIASSLVILMLMSMIHLENIKVYAATTDYPNVFTLVVEDTNGSIMQGVQVRVWDKNNTSNFQETYITNENGLVVMNEVTNKAMQEDIELSIEISKEGYITETFDYSATNSNCTEHLEKKLTELADIDESIIEIRTYDGYYDGDEHGVEVFIDGVSYDEQNNYTVMFKEEEGNYENDSPKFIESGEYKVYVKISKDGYKTLEKETEVKIKLRDINARIIERFNGSDNEVQGTNDVENSYEVEYNEQNHGVEVIIDEDDDINNGNDGYTVKYKVDGVDYSESGFPKFKDAGTYKVDYTISKVGYKTIQKKVAIVIKPKEYSYVIGNDNLELIYGEEDKYRILTNTEHPLKSNEKFYVVSDENGIILNVGQDQIIPGGEIEFNDNKVGAITIKAVIEGNRNYARAECEATININMKEPNNDYRTIEGVKGNNNWYVSNVEIIPKEGEWISKDSKKSGEWLDKIVFSDEGIERNVKVFFRNIIKHSITSSLDIGNIKIDKSKPSDLAIDYGVYENKVISELNGQEVNYLYYKDTPTIKISAKDNVSGIEKMKYSYSMQGDNKETITVDVGNNDGVFKKELVTRNISLPSDNAFEGRITFDAIDGAGNSNQYNDNNIIRVDKLAPEITINTSSAAECENGKFYSDDVNVEIRIKEDYFFEEDVNIIVTETDNKNIKTEYKKEQLNISFNSVGNEHIANLCFNKEADYIIEVVLKDKVNNEVKVTKEFVIDKTAPIINVSYDNNNVKNGSKFNSNRNATITFTEHNFDKDGVKITVEENDKEVDYTSKTTWREAGNDTYIASISFTKETNYTFSVSCTDKANNKNGTIKYGLSTKAPNIFTIDKTKPSTTIKIGNVEWSQTWDRFPTVNNDKRFFGLADNNKVTVQVTSKDSLSGIDYVEYIKADDILSLDTVKKKTWTKAKINSKGTFTFDVDPTKKDERFVIYVHVVDKAGNEYYASSDGIIVDASLPNVEKVSPVITVKPAQPSKSGIYNKNVLVDVVVKEPITGSDVYSGLKSVKYEIYNMSLNDEKTLTGKGTLYEFKNSAPQKEDLVQWVSSINKNAFGTKLNQILVDAAKNNSNSVVVKVIAVDNAGNIGVGQCTIKIDTTKPTIKVGYDNNSPDSSKYFKNNRTATIVVTERNFNPKDVKITIKNTDGYIPKVSNWRKKTGTGNLDNTTWSATVSYNRDGDYEFDISYTDSANNKCNSVTYERGTVAGTAFTIDKTNPTVKVSYDNNSAKNKNYYKDTRVATVVVTEHNFNKERVKVDISATNDGKGVAKPQISGWSTKGDTHTARITYSTDAYYTFDIDVQDSAGNSSDDFGKQDFYVDKTTPKLEISGVKNNEAYKGEVQPIVKFSDINFASDNVSITLNGANRGDIKLDGGYTNVKNGKTFTFKNFANKKEVDDIYTLTATLTDKAGNTTKKEVIFSVNRYGSTYSLSKEAKNINGSYVKKAKDVVLTEVNVNKLDDIKITLFKNNETIVLKEGSDYEIDVTGGDGEWYSYTYTIYAKNFEDDGVYRISVHSEDKAGNVAENTQDVKDTEISFGVDKTKPNIVVANIKSNKAYEGEKLKVKLSANDNILVKKITVYLDGTNEYSWNEKEVTEIIEKNGEFTFDVPGDDGKAHNVRIECVDAAGNEQVEEITNFRVTTNKFVLFYNNNTPLFWGLIIGVIALIGLIVFIVVNKKKKSR